MQSLEDCACYFPGRGTSTHPWALRWFINKPTQMPSSTWARSKQTQSEQDDCVLMDSRLLHRGTANVSGRQKASWLVGSKGSTSTLLPEHESKYTSADRGTWWSSTHGGCNPNFSKDMQTRVKASSTRSSGTSKWTDLYIPTRSLAGTTTDIPDSFTAQSAQQHAFQEQAAFAAATE